jgi:hypothetical protein
MEQSRSFSDKWQEARPSKTAFFWACVASAVVTMIIGFTWGGWVRGATAQSIAEGRAEDAVAQRLAHICVFQSHQDAARDQKLKELKALSAYDRESYVEKQGWAKMPGEQDTDTKVAEDCAGLLTQ